MESVYPSQFDKFFYRLASAVILAAAFFSFVLYYFIFFPTNILKVNKVPVRVHPREVHPGDMISFELDYCKKENAPSFITVAFVDTVLLPTFSTVKNFPTGCNVENPTIQIPYTMRPGKVRMLISIEYKKSVLSVEHHEFDSEDFFVLESTQSAGRLE